MPQFTVDKDGHYKSGSFKDGKFEGKFVEEKDIPQGARGALKAAKPGQYVDELGDGFDPETDLDESEDENLSKTPQKDANAKTLEASPKPKGSLAKASEKSQRKAADPKTAADETPEDDQSDNADDQSDDQAKEDEELSSYLDANGTPTEQSEEGMGFPRSGGRTLSVFSKKPHETVKAIAGFLVPMTQEEYDTKTDMEVLRKLRSLKKI